MLMGLGVCENRLFVLGVSPSLSNVFVKYSSEVGLKKVLFEVFRIAETSCFNMHNVMCACSMTSVFKVSSFLIAKLVDIS